MAAPLGAAPCGGGVTTGDQLCAQYQLKDSIRIQKTNQVGKWEALVFMQCACMAPKLSCFLFLFLFLLSQPAAALEFVEICEKGSPGMDLESPEIQIFRRTSHWINYTQVLEICIPS